MVRRTMQTNRIKQLECSPEYVPDLELMDCMLGWSTGWSGWRITKGGGIKSWLRWIWNAGSITEYEGRYLMHLDFAATQKCHYYGDRVYHYCHQGELREFDERLKSS